jgi:hypothetical protein
MYVAVIVSYGISVSGMSRGFLNIFHTLTEALWPVIALWPVHSLTSVNARKLAKRESQSGVLAARALWRGCHWNLSFAARPAGSRVGLEGVRCTLISRSDSLRVLDPRVG